MCKAEAEQVRLGDAIVGVAPGTPAWDGILPAFMRARGTVAAFEPRLERAAKVMMIAENMAAIYTPYVAAAPPVPRGIGWTAE